MGISDIPLTEEGVAQAKKTARYLAGYTIDHIATSPLIRAVQTAEAIRSAHPESTFEIMSDLHERSFGVLEGLSYEEANARYPQIILDTMWQYPTFCPPEGESLTDVAARARNVFMTLSASHPGSTIVLVSHGSFIRNFFSEILRVPLEEINRYGFTNASVSIVRYSPTEGGEAHIINQSAE